METGLALLLGLLYKPFMTSMLREIPPEGMVVCNLKRIMDERGLTVAETARLANLSRPTIRKLRNNPTTPAETTTIAKLCHGLRIGIGVLFVHKTQKEIELSPALMGVNES